MSRRKAEEAILEGRVAINGETVVGLGTSIDPEKDQVSVDGVTVEALSVKKTLLFYKDILNYNCLFIFQC